MVHEIFKHALAHRYAAVKAQHPTEGRRKWNLRVLYESWPTIGSKNSAVKAPIDTSFETDTDSLDEFLEDEETGIIVRTNFSNDEAWNTFVQKFQSAQKELLSDLAGGETEDTEEGPSTSTTGDTVMADDTQPTVGTYGTITEDGDSDSSSDMPDIMKILDPSGPADRARFTNISNLTALRLFNDVDVRPAPSRPVGTKQISPQNPLIDQAGWQEIYTGKNIWIYDERSNTDDCLRIVSQEGNFYGTATGDSWRARASHVCELQFSMAYRGMKIDFNGLDKWDWNERVRNLAESGSL